MYINDDETCLNTSLSVRPSAERASPPNLFNVHIFQTTKAKSTKLAQHKSFKPLFRQGYRLKSNYIYTGYNKNY